MKEKKVVKEEPTLSELVATYLTIKKAIKELEKSESELSAQVESVMTKDKVEKQEVEQGYVQMTTRILTKKEEGYETAYKRFADMAEKKNLVTYYSKQILTSRLAKE
jgi:hypothetical protein